MNRYIQKLKKELLNYPIVYGLLIFVLIFAFVLRVYRVGSILGFYFDQGRDAMVIWDLLSRGKLFLVGPTTGIAGIFRGPFYYYLITPFYLLGGGNPIWPSVFLAFTSVCAILVLYMLGKQMQDRTTGLIAATIAAFSFYIVLASRWLSNPTPMLLLSVLILWMMLAILKGNKNGWYGLALLSGFSLFHFGSSGEFFYFPAFLIFAIWQRKQWPSFKGILMAFVLFFISALPLIIFDIRHDGVLLVNIKKFFIDDGSFKTNFWDVARIRLDFYYDVFTSKIFETRLQVEKTMLGIVAAVLLISLPRYVRNKRVVVLFLFMISPLIGLLFFQGNYGNIYDYYLTGYYLPFILVFSLGLGLIWRNPVGKLFVIYFFFVFYQRNIPLIVSRLTDTFQGEHSIGFSNQKQAIDWIYNDAQGGNFSVDVYVPPVIPHAYDYLFKWYGGRVKGYEPSIDRIDPLYTLYEVDPPHPERIEAWFRRQNGIGIVEREATFGGITVQRRSRIKK